MTTMLASPYQDFRNHFAEINDLCCVINSLTWDSRTQMPPGGARTRGEQLATVTRLAQARFVSDETGRLIDRAAAEVASDNDPKGNDPQGNDPKGNDPQGRRIPDGVDSYRLREVRQAREAYDIARRVPTELMGEIAALKAPAQQVWAEAKAASDFASFAPYLEQMLGLTRRMAEAIGYAEHPYDALLMRYEPGMTSSRLKALFGELKAGLLPLLRQIGDRGQETRADFLERDYPEDAQAAFALEIAARLRLRPESRPARPVGASLRDLIHARGRSHHHPVQPPLPAHGDLRDLPRDGPRAVRARGGSGSDAQRPDH